MFVWIVSYIVPEKPLTGSGQLNYYILLFYVQPRSLVKMSENIFHASFWPKIDLNVTG